jgi:signal transduction histidine kinase
MNERIRILVIDDSEDDRLLYQRALRGGNGGDFEIVEKTEGEEGLACIPDIKPACILLDYSLPGRNGIEVLKRIRSKFSFIAVVMLTGQGNEAVAIAAIREGAQHYVAKSSITPESLQRSVRLAIEHCNLERNVYEQRLSLELFTHALAHDLKEPVRTIKSYLELLMRQEMPPDRTRQYFDYILQAASRMSSLIDTVYLYMRLDHSAPRATQEACDSMQALAEAKENLAALIRERNAVITADALPQVMSSRMQLIQLLQNLLGNAIRHCEGTPTIYVSAKATGRYFTFHVDDNGPGIPAAYREKIFEPFKRLVTHKEDGLGLGLAICKKIIEASGGKIWCEANEPQGASFRFTLPKGEPIAVVPLETMPRPLVPFFTDALATILFVEDSEADIELTRYTLMEEQKLCCYFSVARNGHEALARLTETSYNLDPVDLVLLDINMPGMDGFEFLSNMRAIDVLCHIPVVMCTTSTYDRDIEQARLLGVAGYLIKPLDFARLKPILTATGRLRLCDEANGYALMRGAA